MLTAEQSTMGQIDDGYSQIVYGQSGYGFIVPDAGVMTFPFTSRIVLTTLRSCRKANVCGSQNGRASEKAESRKPTKCFCCDRPSP
jgi:hypothetical protein